MSNDGNKEVTFPYSLSVRDLAEQLNASPVQVIKILMANGVMASINQTVDFDTAAVVATELGFTPQLQKEEIQVEETGEIPLWRQVIMDEDPTKLENRPPVITILGHVDHGKTTLLDAVRHTNVAGGEAGGITQHIGAYQVMHMNRLKLPFWSLPGHAAFSSMRARGAKGADIVILVCGTDDGVQRRQKRRSTMPKQPKCRFVVALNKLKSRMPILNWSCVSWLISDCSLMNGKATPLWCLFPRRPARGWKTCWKPSCWLLTTWSLKRTPKAPVSAP
jgi:translation initiation factor IF-2